jgi:hypothetical protein
VGSCPLPTNSSLEWRARRPSARTVIGKSAHVVETRSVGAAGATDDRQVVSAARVIVYLAISLARRTRVQAPVRSDVGGLHDHLVYLYVGARRAAGR